jgi:plasmid stabilization system protein ParE
MKPLILLPRAEAELFDAALWYENERAGLGVAFEQDFDAIGSRIRAAPRQFPEIEPQIRRALFHRFPYAVFFVVEAEELVVIAVLHQRRDPDTWRGRYKNLK